MNAAICHIDPETSAEEWTRDHLIIDVTQNEHMRSNALRQSLAPALLKRSKLWDLPQDQAIPVAMHWLIQGFCHPSAKSLSWREHERFPFRELVSGTDEALTCSEQRALTGNSMHTAAVGSFLAHCLGQLEFRVFANNRASR